MFSFEKAVSVVRTSTFSTLQTSLLTLVCWWLTVQQLGDLQLSESAGSIVCCWAADVTARLGSDLLSEAVKNDSIHLDIMATLSHLHWQITLTFFFFNICVCVFPIYRPWGRGNACQSILRRGTSWLFNVRWTHTAILYNPRFGKDLILKNSYHISHCFFLSQRS